MTIYEQLLIASLDALLRRTRPLPLPPQHPLLAAHSPRQRAFAAPCTSHPEVSSESSKTKLAAAAKKAQQQPEKTGKGQAWPFRDRPSPSNGNPNPINPECVLEAETDQVFFHALTT